MKIIYAEDPWNRFRGLMFRKKPIIIIFPFNVSNRYFSSIHSFFVFFDFYAIYIDNEGKVFEKILVKPFKFRITPKKIPSFLIEVPIEIGKKIEINEYIGMSKKELIENIKKYI